MIGILYLIPICMASFLAGIFLMNYAYIRSNNRLVEEAVAANVYYQDRLRDCETSLNIFDEGRVSEYWMRHGEHND